MPSNRSRFAPDQIVRNVPTLVKRPIADILDGREAVFPFGYVRYWPKADIPGCIAHVRFQW